MKFTAILLFLAGYAVGVVMSMRHYEEEAVKETLTEAHIFADATKSCANQIDTALLESAKCSARLDETYKRNEAMADSLFACRNGKRR